VVTICTISLTFTDSTFCPHTVYLCVLCGSENKQQLFPYTASTDCFVYLRRSVFTARYEFNYCIKFMAVGRRPFTVEPGFDPRSVHMRFLLGKDTQGQIFFPEYFGFSLSVSFPPIIRTHLTYTSLLLEGQTGEVWEPSKKQCSLGNHGALDRKVLSRIDIWRVNA